MNWVHAHHNKTRTCCCVYLNAARGILVCLGKLLNAQQDAVQDSQSENSVCCGCLFAALQPGSAVAMFQSVHGGYTCWLPMQNFYFFNQIKLVKINAQLCETNYLWLTHMGKGAWFKG